MMPHPKTIRPASAPKRNLQIEYLSPGALKPDPNNARRHPKKQIERLAAGMRVFGFTNPVLIDEEDHVIAGHAAMTELGNETKQEVGRWANNRVENSHLSFGRRERWMARFRRMKTLQKFASVHANVHNHFALERQLVDRQTFKQRRAAALNEWRLLAG